MKVSKQNRPARLLGLIGLLLVAVTSCQSDVGKQDRSYSERLQEARSALHRGDLEKSKDLLQELNGEFPFREEVQVTLASVYIAEARLSIDQFYPFAESVIDVLDDQKSLWREPWWLSEKDSKEGVSGQLQNSLHQLLKVTSRLTNFFYLFDRLPSVPAERRPALEEALAILDGVHIHKRGVALYRAILRAVLLKAHLKDPLQLVAWVEDCEISVKEVYHRVDQAWTYVRYIFVDLSMSFPRKNSDMRGWRKEGDEVVTWLSEEAQRNPSEKFASLIVKAGFRELRMKRGCE